ncbi:hypothetical protein [Acetobacter aceti]|uniref:Uncharacterized protein n=1 Tax=Acetobacter aceti TaxID=435 RepID=A0A6S6PN24_ACEAC|nr:hypothetical protein [Acetobacter aceti]BCI68065.1 hypothetical protein AAJCM20276_26890 [Acetobacter aceti]
MSETSVTVTASRTRSDWSTPRCRLLVNGLEQTAFGVASTSLQQTRYARCDTLDATFSFDPSVTLPPYWFDVADPEEGQTLPDIDVQFQMQDAETGGAQWTTKFQGILDHVSLQLHRGQVQIQCRDYLAKLMDMRVQEAWLNMTGPELMKAVITAAGLAPDVQFTSGMEGQFWQIEHKRHSSHGQTRFQTAFDLARYVANGANCDLYASGKTIVCRPYPSASSSGAVVHTLKYTPASAGSFAQVAVVDLSMERDYQTAKGVVVHCVSWDSKQRIKSEIYWSALGGSKKNALENGTLHSFRFIGLKQDQLSVKAEMLYRQIVAHERTISLTIPGRTNLAPRQFFTLTGTGTTWDGTRDVDAVTSSLDWSGGYTQSVTLRTRDTSDQENSEND